jgi:methyltransferase
MTPHWIPLALVGWVVAQRLAELVLARRNTRVLIDEEGAREVAPGHYPLIVALHAAWLAAVAWVAWHATEIHWPWLALFLILQVGRVWVLVTLGRYWTTRIIVVPDAPLIRRGPYRYTRHPNYLIVAGEIVALPLVFGAWEVALVFSILNAGVLAVRIRAEEAANEHRGPLTPSS